MQIPPLGPQGQLVPDEIWSTILSHMPPDEKISLSRVNSYFYQKTVQNLKQQKTQASVFLESLINFDNEFMIFSL